MDYLVCARRSFPWYLVYLVPLVLHTPLRQRFNFSSTCKRQSKGAASSVHLPPSPSPSPSPVVTFSLSSAATLFAAVCRYSCSSSSSQESLSLLVLATCFCAIFPVLLRRALVFYSRNFTRILSTFWAI